jgi:hypothetical protein
MVTISFNGSVKCVLVALGVGETEVTIDVKEDLYSDWKVWVTQSDNSKYLPAFSSIGGDPKGGGQFVGASYFIQNDWRICISQVETQCLIRFDGELLSNNDGGVIFGYENLTSGQILSVERILPVVSNIISTGGSALTSQEHQQLMKTLTKNQFLGLK